MCNEIEQIKKEISLGQTGWCKMETTNMLTLLHALFIFLFLIQYFYRRVENLITPKIY